MGVKNKAFQTALAWIRLDFIGLSQRVKNLEDLRQELNEARVSLAGLSGAVQRLEREATSEGATMTLEEAGPGLGLADALALVDARNAEIVRLKDTASQSILRTQVGDALADGDSIFQASARCPGEAIEWVRRKLLYPPTSPGYMGPCKNGDQ